jgi:PAS domain S-box-containing protein
MVNKKILLVEDDSLEGMDLKRTLESFGYTVPYVASNGEEAVEKAYEIMPDLILMDIFLKGDSDGIEAAKKIKELNIPVIFITAHSKESKIERAKHTEPYGIIIKPYDNNELKYTIELALYKNKIENELKESDKSYRDLVNNSMVAIYKTNINGDIIFANDAMAEMFNFESVEALKTTKSPHLYKNPNDRNKIIEKLRKKGSINHHEMDMKSNTGETITILLSAYLNDNIISGMMMDITERKKMEEKLRESEGKYSEVFNNANDMISLNLVKDDGLPGKFIDVNEIGIERLGYSRNEFLNMTPADIVDPDKRSEMPKNALKLSKKGYIEFEIIHQAKDGKRIPVEVNNHLFELNGKKVALAISRDITERKKAEDALKNSEIKYRTIFENVQDVFYQLDKQGNIIEISPSIERNSGYKPSELIGKPAEMFYLNPEDRKYLIKEIEEKGEVDDYELTFKTKSKNLLYVSTNAHFLFDSSKNPIGIEGSLRDLTERKNIEIQLKQSLIEKEILLKEIHHRVKNNLMIISSLLDLESRYIKDKASKDIFKESQNRARSMALIHERLYQSTDLKRIDFGEYISSLATELFHTYESDPGLIELKINAENILLDINTAIPLGLIVNELITNSLKHAFPKGMKGEIIVDFHPINDHYEFTVKDNGIGFPEDLDYQNTDSLGLQIVNSLTDQIDGEIELDRNNGTEFKITFKELDCNKG